MQKIVLRHDVYMSAKENSLFAYDEAKQTILDAWQVATLGELQLSENGK